MLKFHILPQLPAGGLAELTGSNPFPVPHHMLATVAPPALRFLMEQTRQISQIPGKQHAYILVGLCHHADITQFFHDHNFFRKNTAVKTPRCRSVVKNHPFLHLAMNDRVRPYKIMQIAPYKLHAFHSIFI